MEGLTLENLKSILQSLSNYREKKSLQEIVTKLIIPSFTNNIILKTVLKSIKSWDTLRKVIEEILHKKFSSFCNLKEAQEVKFRDPITNRVVVNPVILKCNGNTYEKYDLIEYLVKNKHCPCAKKHEYSSSFLDDNINENVTLREKLTQYIISFLEEANKLIFIAYKYFENFKTFEGRIDVIGKDVLQVLEKGEFFFTHHNQLMRDESIKIEKKSEKSERERKLRLEMEKFVGLYSVFYSRYSANEKKAFFARKFLFKQFISQNKYPTIFSVFSLDEIDELVREKGIEKEMKYPNELASEMSELFTNLMQHSGTKYMRVLEIIVNFYEKKSDFKRVLDVVLKCYVNQMNFDVIMVYLGFLKRQKDGFNTQRIHTVLESLPTRSEKIRLIVELFSVYKKNEESISELCIMLLKIDPSYGKLKSVLKTCDLEMNMNSFLVKLVYKLAIEKEKMEERMNEFFKKNTIKFRSVQRQLDEIKSSLHGKEYQNVTKSSIIRPSNVSGGEESEGEFNFDYESFGSFSTDTNFTDSNLSPTLNLKQSGEIEQNYEEIKRIFKTSQSSSVKTPVLPQEEVQELIIPLNNNNNNNNNGLNNNNNNTNGLNSNNNGLNGNNNGLNNSNNQSIRSYSTYDNTFVGNKNFQQEGMNYYNSNNHLSYVSEVEDGGGSGGGGGNGYGFESKSVYVPDLHSQVTRSDLLEYFKDCGLIDSIYLSDVGTNNKRFAYVNFADERSVKQARLRNGGLFQNENIKIQDTSRSPTPMNFRSIMVKNLPKRMTKVEIYNFFNSCGKINGIYLNKLDQFAYINFDDSESAEKAFEFEGKVIYNSKISISYSQRKDVIISRTIRVERVPARLTKKKIKIHFEEYLGEKTVQDVDLKKGNCKVTFYDVEICDRALDLDGKKINKQMTLDLYPIPAEGQSYDKSIFSSFLTNIPTKFKKKDVKKNFWKCGVFFNVEFNSNHTVCSIDFQSSSGVEECLKMSGTVIDGNKISISKFDQKLYHKYFKQKKKRGKK